MKDSLVVVCPFLILIVTPYYTISVLEYFQAKYALALLCQKSIECIAQLYKHVCYVFNGRIFCLYSALLLLSSFANKCAHQNILNVYTFIIYLSLVYLIFLISKRNTSYLRQPCKVRRNTDIANWMTSTATTVRDK